MVMVYLEAALALVVGLLLLNLLLSLGIVRRLRQQDARLVALESGRNRVRPGTNVPAFSTTTIDGEPLTEGWFQERLSIVAFVSYGCSACHEQLPVLTEMLSRPESGGLKALVAIAALGDGDPEELPTSL